MQTDWQTEVKLLHELALKIGYNEIVKKTGIPKPNLSRFFNCHFEPKLGTFLTIKTAINELTIDQTTGTGS